MAEVPCANRSTIQPPASHPLRNGMRFGQREAAPGPEFRITATLATTASAGPRLAASIGLAIP